MRLEMSTDMLPIVIPDTYGTEFCYDIDESMWEDFKELMIKKAWAYIAGALTETDFIDAFVKMKDFVSPREYNFTTDRIDFDMDFDDELIDVVRSKVNDDFFKYAKKFDSYDGFISFYPVGKDKFYEALEGKRKDKLALAISMYILWQFEKENDLDKYREDYIEDVREYAFANGYCVDDYYEEE